MTASARQGRRAFQLLLFPFFSDSFGNHIGSIRSLLVKIDELVFSIYRLLYFSLGEERWEYIRKVCFVSVVFL